MSQWRQDRSTQLYKYRDTGVEPVGTERARSDISIDTLVLSTQLYKYRYTGVETAGAG